MNLAGYIERPKFREVFLAKNQNIKDLQSAIIKAINESVPQAEKVNLYWKKNNINATLNNVYNWTKKNIKYYREGADEQSVKTLSRIICDPDKRGDCKHYTIAISSILLSYGIPVTLKMVSFNYFDKEPKHIYPVIKYKGQKIILDCCMKSINDECAYKHAEEIKLKPIN